MQDNIEIFASLLVVVCTLSLWAALWAKIFTKAGYPASMGLMCFIPIGALIAILILALSTWPPHRRVVAKEEAANDHT
jgi:hypothetical protein